MKWIDQIFGPELAGKKTEYLALAASLVGALTLALDMFAGINLGPEWVSILENAVAIGFALTIGARLTRTNEAVKRIEMAQPAEPAQPVQPQLPEELPNFREGGKDVV